jgi:hypothetical protein
MSDDAPSSSPSWQRIKDVVELFSKIATIVLTGVALFATSIYNRQQTREHDAQVALQQVQTVTGLFEPLTSTDRKKHGLAVIAVKELTTNPVLALRLCLAAASTAECAGPASTFATDTLLHLSDDSEHGDPRLQRIAQTALDIRQAAPDTLWRRAQLAISTLLPPGSSHGDSSQRSLDQRTGWVFLGTYTEGTWLSRYLDFPTTSPPASLRGHTFHVRAETGALNVRGNILHEAGYVRILDVLSEGSSVAIDSVASFRNLGYYIYGHARYHITGP